MIILDTNVISETFRPRPNTRVVVWLQQLTGDVAITSITLAEIMAGVGRLPEGKRKAALSIGIGAALQPYRQSGAVLAFDDVAADHYAQIVVARLRAGRPISMADAQIAAICRTRSAVCATRNVRDFEHTGVEVLDPWAA